MEDSEPAEDGLLAGLRWNRSAREQVQLKHKIRDLPGLLKHGLHLRKKSQSPDTIPGPSAGPTVHKSCSQSFPCAGRAVRNAFLSHGPYPAKDKIHLARIIRRSYVGVELVQWLCEQCLYVRCRTTAVRVWQVLLELGVLLSVDQRVVFSDSNTYYQFSFEECDSASCEFRTNEGEWPEAVRLLLQLAPYVQFRSGGGANSPSEEDSEGNRDICSEMLQMKALERLTSTVQSELAAALARKTRKALSEQDSETMETSQQEPRTPSEESSPLSGVCTLRGGGGGEGIGTCSREELTSRLGLETVQRLAKDGCRLLQNHNYRLSDRNQAPCIVQDPRVSVTASDFMSCQQTFLCPIRLDEAVLQRKTLLLILELLLTWSYNEDERQTRNIVKPVKVWYDKSKITVENSNIFTKNLCSRKYGLEVQLLLLCSIYDNDANKRSKHINVF